MKQLLFLTSICILFAMSSCESSEIREGVDVGGVFITNSTKNELNVSSGKNLNVEYKISPKENTSIEEYQNVTFESSNSEIFQVNDKGAITGKRNGTARLIITASSEKHNVKGSCVVRVTDQVFVKNIELDESVANIRINIDEEGKFQILPEHFSVLPENALIRDVAYASSEPHIASVNQDGLITAESGGKAVISILSTDGSGVKVDISVSVLAPIFTWYLEERRGFEIDYKPGLIKYPLNTDGSGFGHLWEFLFDEGSNWQASFISLSKPGRGTIPNAVAGDIFIPIDMKKELKFNQIYIRHRSTLQYARLKMWAFDLLASDDGENFLPLVAGVEIPNAKVDSSIDATIVFDKTFTSRYIKIVPTAWDTASGNTMQVSDLKIGYDESKDPNFGK